MKRACEESPCGPPRAGSTGRIQVLPRVGLRGKLLWNSQSVSAQALASQERLEVSAARPGRQGRASPQITMADSRIIQPLFCASLSARGRSCGPPHYLAIIFPCTAPIFHIFTEPLACRVRTPEEFRTPGHLEPFIQRWSNGVLIQPLSLELHGIPTSSSIISARRDEKRAPHRS